MRTMTATNEAEGPAVVFFKDLSMKDVALVGGKNASLGEMFQQLGKIGVRVPNGFAVTIRAFKAALSDKDIAKLHEALDPLNKLSPDFVKNLSISGSICRDVVYKAGLTPKHTQEIVQAYRQLNDEYSDAQNNLGISVAVRSSATAEDLPTASFAGQHDTYLNIEGETQLLDAIRRCMASLFTDRAISYRIDQDFDHFKVVIFAGVMKMVRSDLASSGVMFSIDTETGYSDAVFITGAFGLGENVVQGTVDPDEYYVHKPTFKKEFRCVLRRRPGKKQMTMVFSTGREPIKNVPTPASKRKLFCLNDKQVLELADCTIKIEDHYTTARGSFCPMDIEWALDGVDHKLYIVQARPETVMSQKKLNFYEQYSIKGPLSNYKVIATGRAVGTKISSGVARLIHNTADLVKFRKGDILIADTTTPDWEPVMKMAAGIVTNRGGRTCHAAIIARELGVAAIVGTDNALTTCKDGSIVTVSCCQGEKGYVFQDKVPFLSESTDLETIGKPSTKMMINLGNPDLAFGLSFLPCDGVGLARMEFIISEYIKIHPMALIHPERVSNPKDLSAISSILENYESGSAYMIRQLSEGIGTIAAAFYPRPVIVRLSDYKSNEYAQLIGGEAFEPKEENPMLGFRGASRYTHPNYVEGFDLECKALARVRHVMGLRNVIIMVPFVRTTGEASKVVDVMAKHGLARGQNELKIYMMCEIPNNVIQIDAFLKFFDGISIGSNDLTQLTLGCDRDSALVADLFDERDPGVQTMIKMAIQGAQRNNAHSGICGQAPSDFPEVAKYLLDLGIGSISLTPDSLIRTILSITGQSVTTSQK